METSSVVIDLDSRELNDSNSFDTTKFSREDLREIYDLIGRVLQLRGLNLEEELQDHYAKCVLARNVALDNLHNPDQISSSASLINVATNALKEVVKMQAELHTIEKVKRLERAMVDTLKSKPDLAGELLETFENKLFLEDI